MRTRLAAIVVCLCGVGCKPSAPSPSAPSAAPPLAFSTTVEGGDARATVSVDKTNFTVGEALEYAIDIDAPKDSIVEFPESREEPDSFQVLRRDVTPGLPKDDRRHWVLRQQLSTFQSGDTVIPRITVVIRSVDAEHPTTIDIPEIPVTVASVLDGDVDPTEYRDIRDSVTVTVDRPPIWEVLYQKLGVLGFAAIALCALIGASLAAWLISRRSSPIPPISPADWARRELESLERTDLLARHEYHPFHVRLTDILRAYVERRFGIMAPERTTDEFLRDAEKSSSISVPHRESLRGFMREADLIKFALYRPQPGDSEKALSLARDFVEATAGEPPTLSKAAPDQGASTR